MNDTRLELRAQKDNHGERRPMPPLPDGVPSTVGRAGLVLSHALLVAELVDVPIEDAQATINTAFAELEDLPRLFSTEDCADLLGFIDALLLNLDIAVDARGLPHRNAWGSALASSSLLEEQPGRGLVLVHRDMPLTELVETLTAIRAQLAFAVEHHLILMIVDQ